MMNHRKCAGLMRSLAAAVTCSALMIWAPRSAEARPGTGDWTGPYVGVDLGYSAGDDEAAEVDGQRFYIADLDGVSGALHLGWQLQRGRLVAGVEAEAGYSGANNSINRDFGSGTVTSGADLGTFGSIAARIGFAPSDRWLLFGKVGAAVTELTATTIQSCPTADLCDGAQSSADSVAVNDDVAWGFLMGGGVEHRLGERWSARLSYTYTDYNAALALPAIDGPGWEHDVDTHSVRVGVSYRF